MPEARLRFSADKHVPRPFVLHIEPWGEDYYFHADKTVDVIAISDVPEPPWFHLHRLSNDETQVYIEGPCTGWQVFEGGVPVQCGHGRPP